MRSNPSVWAAPANPCGRAAETLAPMCVQRTTAIARRMERTYTSYYLGPGKRGKRQAPPLSRPKPDPAITTCLITKLRSRHKGILPDLQCESNVRSRWRDLWQASPAQDLREKKTFSLPPRSVRAAVGGPACSTGIIDSCGATSHHSLLSILIQLVERARATSLTPLLAACRTNTLDSLNGLVRLDAWA